MKTTYTLAAIAVSLLLSACGSSDKEENVIPAPVTDNAPSENASDNGSSDEGSDDEDSTPPAYSVGGKVIDGYVSGATVWIDFNSNGVKDDDEPSAVSGDAGDYSLELSETERQCAQYSTWYVDVPVGAIDEDLGEVTEAYQMVRPPVLDAITDETLLHISPLTTALWQGIQEELNGSTISDCETLVADQENRDSVAQLIDSTIYNTVSFYNISEDEIFEDFIAEGNEESKALAQEIVQGLQKSLSYTSVVKEQYPSADEVRVVYYKGTNLHYSDDEDEHWFRDVVVFEGDNFYSREDMMSDTLEEVVTPIYYRDALSSEWGDGEYTLTSDFIYSGSVKGYNCAFSEEVSVVKSEVTYSLMNHSPRDTHVATIEACPEPEITGAVFRREFDIQYEQDGKQYLSDIRQYEENIVGLSEWVNFEGRSEDFDFADLISESENLGYKFDEEVRVASDYWYKRQYWWEGDTYVSIQYDSDGNWKKYTRFEDGTHTDECSYDEGQTWKACEE
ncbi:hypothetical protein [Alteromonas ponticola]|uniref:Carboxypeptidase regulatory-like domain-containing protein n=1 Tax=Alteromonas ponticola TaxID=2720613 RepID=A0ABX1R7I6_9ALTE|nr:hypothetical protein [Alteromonas ponticola]NMH61437.1 hypothetical protein [Alteromonas ponticola]